MHSFYSILLTLVFLAVAPGRQGVIHSMDDPGYAGYMSVEGLLCASPTEEDSLSREPADFVPVNVADRRAGESFGAVLLRHTATTQLSCISNRDVAPTSPALPSFSRHLFFCVILS